MMNWFLAETEAAPTNNVWTYVILGVVLVAVVVVLIVMPWLNNKKSQKKYKSMMDSVNVGVTVKTIGGVVGKVVAVNTVSPNVREFVLLTGTGDNKTEMTFDINALYQVIDENTHEPVPMEPVAPVVEEKSAEVKTEEPFVESTETVDAEVTATEAASEEKIAEVVESTPKKASKKK